jgi:hypothetical protein
MEKEILNYLKNNPSIKIYDLVDAIIESNSNYAPVDVKLLIWWLLYTGKIKMSSDRNLTLENEN